jgi:hypothetical protein
MDQSEKSLPAEEYLPNILEELILGKRNIN